MNKVGEQGMAHQPGHGVAVCAGSMSQTGTEALPGQALSSAGGQHPHQESSGTVSTWKKAMCVPQRMW